MKYAPDTAHIDSRLFGVLLTPSWLSSVFAVCCSTVFCVGIIVLTRYQASNLRLDFLDYQAKQIAGTYQTVGGALSQNAFIGNLPLLIFWSLVGAVIYLFAANIFVAINNTAELRNELGYVNVNRRELLRTAIIHLCVRLVVAGVWVVYALFFFHHVLPYYTALSIAGSAQVGGPQDVGYALLAIIVMSIAIHLHVILLRLFLVRPRIFTRALYVD